MLYFEKSSNMAKNEEKNPCSTCLQLISPRYCGYPNPGFRIPVPPLLCIREVIYLSPMFIMPYNSRSRKAWDILNTIEYHTAFFQYKTVRERITALKRTYFEIFELVNTMFVSKNSYCFHEKMSILSDI